MLLWAGAGSQGAHLRAALQEQRVGSLFTDPNNAAAPHREIPDAFVLRTKANAAQIFLLPESGKLGVSHPTWEVNTVLEPNSAHLCLFPGMPWTLFTDSFTAFRQILATKPIPCCWTTSAWTAGESSWSPLRNSCQSSTLSTGPRTARSPRRRTGRWSWLSAPGRKLPVTQFRSEESGHLCRVRIM